MPLLSALPLADLATSVATAAPAGVPALLPEWLNAPTLLERLGDFALWGAVLIVFAECGLLIGFFLPGDSLLFTVGMFVTLGAIGQPLWLACLLLTASAFLGNVCGYEIGRRLGPAVLDRPDSRLFRREHVHKTSAFFDRYGPRAVVLARFVPIVRTFITVTAGAAAMPRRTFFYWSGVGAVLWATGVTVLGSVLGGIPAVREHVEAGLLLIVAVSLVPIAVEALRARLGSTVPAGSAVGRPTVADVVADVVPTVAPPTVVAPARPLDDVEDAARR